MWESSGKKIFGFFNPVGFPAGHRNPRHCARVAVRKLNHGAVEHGLHVFAGKVDAIECAGFSVALVPIGTNPKHFVAVGRRIGADGQNNHAGLGCMAVNVAKSCKPIERNRREGHFLVIVTIDVMPFFGAFSIGAKAQHVGKLVQRDAAKAGLLAVLIERHQRAVIPVTFGRFPQQVNALRGEAAVPKDVLEKRCAHGADQICFRRIRVRRSGCGEFARAAERQKLNANRRSIVQTVFQERAKIIGGLENGSFLSRREKTFAAIPAIGFGYRRFAWGQDEKGKKRAAVRRVHREFFIGLGRL